MRRVLLIILAVLAVIVVVPVVALLVFDWNAAREFVAKQASDATGRNVAIGDLDVDWSFTPLITAKNIRVENAPWGSAEHMIDIERLDVRVDLLELLMFRVVLPEVSLSKPFVLLAKNERGEANWTFGDAPVAGAAVEASVPEERTEFPIIGSLGVDDGTLIYRDAKRGIDIKMKVSEAIGEGAGGERRLSLEGEGQFEGKAFSLDVKAGSLKTLRADEEPYPLDVSASIGETTISAEGTMVEPLAVKGVDLDFAVEGQDMSELFPIFGIPLPPTKHYALSGHLTRSGAVWDFTNLSGEMGDSDLGGDVKVDTGAEPPQFFATLTSRNLDFDDLAPLIGGGSADKTPGGGVIPDMPINIDRLQAMNMRVVFDGENVNAPGLPIEKLHFTAETEDGRLTIDPLTFGVSDGTVAGKVILDGQQNPPRADADFDVEQVRLKPFVDATEYFDASAGLIGGHLELAGQGASLAELLAKSDGRFVLVMTGGQISAQAIEGAGLDIAEFLAVTLTDENASVPLRCAVVDFPIESGIAKTKTIAVDTTDSLIVGDGSVNLAEETLDLEFLAHPKDFSVLSARTPLQVNGTFADPSFGIDPSGLIARAAVAAALSVALTPIGALIPFIELGVGEDSNCTELIREANQFTD